MKYTKVKLNFINKFPEELKNHLYNTADFLECMLNSTMLEKFVLEGNYTNEKNEMNLSNSQIYDLLKKHDWDLQLKYRGPEISGNSPMSVKYGNTIMVRDFVKDYTLAKSAAIMAHEQGHILGLNHTRGYKPHQSFSWYLQDKGELLFNNYEGKVLKPQVGKILTETKRDFPFCWLSKKIEWK